MANPEELADTANHCKNVYHTDEDLVAIGDEVRCLACLEDCLNGASALDPREQ